MMIVYSGIILLIVTGYMLINCISTCFNQMEKIGLSFPVGLAVQTFLMLLLDMLSIPFTKTSLFSLQLFTLIGCGIYLFKTGFYKTVFSFSCWKMYKGINLVWLLFLIGIIWIEYMNFSKCIYFPPFDRDSLAAFETIGYVTAQDQTFKHNILYNSGYNINVHGPGSYISYTPMVMLSYAYVYVLGAVNSKLINAFIYLFFLISLYGCGKRLTTKTGAIIATFFILLTPEMLAFSSLSTTNVIQAIYVGPAVLYSVLWFRKRQRKDLYMAALLMGCNIWSRTEGIVFIGAVVCLLGIDAIRKKSWKELLIFGFISLFPLIIWLTFSRLYGLYSENVVITKPFWDVDKITQIGTTIARLTTISNYYGWSVYAFLIGLISNLWFLIKRRDNLNFLCVILLSLLFYMIILYQIDYKWDSLMNVLIYSAKRFLFCFIPLVWFYLFTNQASVLILKKMDRFLAFKR